MTENCKSRYIIEIHRYLCGEKIWGNTENVQTYY